MAIAMELGAPLISVDEAIAATGVVEVIWYTKPIPMTCVKRPATHVVSIGQSGRG